MSSYGGPWMPLEPVLQIPTPNRKAILVAVDALLAFGGSATIADTLPRIELARRLLKEID